MIAGFRAAARRWPRPGHDCPTRRRRRRARARRRQLQQPVGRAAQLERAAGLQALAFQPQPAPSICVSISGVRSTSPAIRVAASSTSSRRRRLSVNPLTSLRLSVNRCVAADEARKPRRNPKNLYMGGPRPYIALPLPHGTSNRKAALVETTRWRSLELHKHHRALGLATAPTGIRRCRIAHATSGPAGDAASSARRRARRPLLRREVSGQVALCGEGQSVARPAADPVGRGRHPLRRRLDRRSAPGRARRCPRRRCASCTR